MRSRTFFNVDSICMHQYSIPNQLFKDPEPKKKEKWLCKGYSSGAVPARSTWQGTTAPSGGSRERIPGRFRGTRRNTVLYD